MRTPRTLKTSYGILNECLSLFSKRDKRKIYLVTIVQAGLSVLDLIGVALIGILGAIAVNGISSRTPGIRTTKVLQFLGLSELSLQYQVTILALLACVFLVAKTFITAILARRIVYFLSARASEMTASMNRGILSGDLEQINNRSSMALLYALTTGVQAVTTGIIASSISVFTDSIMLVVIISGLIIVDPIVAFLVLFLFGSMGYLLFVIQQKRALALGIESADLQIRSSRLLLEEFSAFREIFVRDKLSHYERLVRNSRLELSANVAEMSFLPSVSKYVMEIVMVFCMLVISAVQFARTDAVHAVATLTLFLAASSRFVPAILRIQQSALTIRNSLGSARPTLDLFKVLVNSDLDTPIILNQHQTKNVIEIKDVSFNYREQESFVLTGLTLEIESGEFIAFVGPSGAGKSTIVDLILGLLTPTTGSISILGNAPRDSIRSYPGLIGYVPQIVYLKHGTIAENIALGFENSDIDYERITEVIEQSQLLDFVTNLPDGYHSEVSEEGKTLSGGQKQRLGIARALYTNPQILILDEATSALDGTTEKDIASQILGLRGTKTVLVIAHRLSTVREADRIYYVDKGKIIDSGKFDELRIRIPDFAKQADLMGL